MQCFGQVFECKTLSAFAGKSQSPKATLFRAALLRSDERAISLLIEMPTIRRNTRV